MNLAVHVSANSFRNDGFGVFSREILQISLDYSD
ncbi:hypothetical protein BXY66_0585 [Shimia isoporae]|uniref:Uncharacterized protein n=1 Tax=Shimia isoporae TaxID=647720 RepID=A0A4R1NTE6_9RHOB|nr:hypothetical protein BXY66_0585 [Shimia isoporae]